MTADHGQCPLPDASGGVRLDPIQLWDDVEREFGGGLFDLVQNVVPSESTCTPTSCGTPAPRARTLRRSCATTPTGEHRSLRPPRRDRAGAPRPSAVRRGVRDDVPGHAGRPRPLAFGPGIYPEAEIADPASRSDRCGSSSRTETAPLLDGEAGEGAALAMRLVEKMAEVARAPRLRDVTWAHIDACLYHGQVGLDFAGAAWPGPARGRRCRRR